jgi:ABC-type polar amino acid transport system ATPase subunit
VIEVEAVHKWYGPLHVLRGITLGVAVGEVVVICGASGSGRARSCAA